MDWLSNVIAILGFVALIVLLRLWKRAKHHSSKGKVVPEVARGLPIIDHMHLFKEKKSLGRIFGPLADKYGPIFSIRLGMHRAIFISDCEIIKDLYTNTNDIHISSRPYATQTKHIGYNGSSFGFAPYGPYWHDMRKLVAIKLLCNSRIKMLNHIPESEINYLLKDLYNHCNEKIDLGKSFSRMTINIITRIVAGKRVFDGNDHQDRRPLSKIIREFLDASVQVVP
ncbi:Steroid 17-alpha-hydroxylase/17 20 lyase [Euphorbia peplus]|nr:Steroid 17-alpha-hydroxylase/17 20 lyase [Euphorbia peplus]